MSAFVIAAPEALATASADLSGIGEAIKDAAAMWAPSTTRIAPAAADEVSAAVARLFVNYAQTYQTLGAQAAAFQQQFVQALSGARAHTRPLRPRAQRFCRSRIRRPWSKTCWARRMHTA